jgi:hypothetical protein
MPHIPLTDCKHRKLYRLASRNLKLGFFEEETRGFLGLRRKFGSTYVFEEYHWDCGPPYGTVHPQEELPEELPAEIELKEDLGAKCSICGQPLEQGGSGWVHEGGHQCNRWYPMTRCNESLEGWLLQMEMKYPSPV